MAKTKESFQIPGGSAELNFVLARIADRLDKIEGIRGAPQINDSLEVTDIATVDDDDGAGTRIKADAKHEEAPASTLADGEWEMTVYDDGANPVFRIRYRRDSDNDFVGDVALL